jgi:hypothetical protein
MLKRRLTLTLTVLVVALLLGSYPAVPAEADHHTKAIGSCRVIDRSDSYTVDKNIEAQGDCIVIATSNVTLDLAGHTITGNGTGAAVRTPGFSSFDAITVRNGSVTNFREGVALMGRHHVVDEVRASDNNVTGIRILTSVGNVIPATVAGGNTVRNSIASRNGKVGDVLHHGIVVVGCFNFPPHGCVIQFGESVSFGHSIIGNVANENGFGIGIRVDCPSTVVNNVATGNTDDYATVGVCTRWGNSPLAENAGP